MSITRPNPFEKAGDASKLSIPQLQQAIKNGTVPAYIGIPLVQEKMKLEQKLQNAAATGQQKPPTVADQVMTEATQAQGVPALETNLPVTMAGGGIVAFAAGDLVDDDEDYDDRDYYNQMALANDEMDAALAERGQQPIVVRHKESTEAKGIGALDPELAARIDALREDYRQKYGKDFRISSGFRTREDQERLYAQRGSNPNLVAAPGHSKHEHGAAVDIPEYIPDDLLRAHGLHRPHGKKDPVHIEKMAHGGKVSYFGDPKKNPNQDQVVEDKYAGLWPYNAPEAGKFTYSPVEDLTDEEKLSRQKSKEKGIAKYLQAAVPAAETTAGLVSYAPEIAAATFPSGTTAARAMGTLGTGAGVVGAVPMVGQAITSKAGRDLATYTTPEQRRALSSNALLSAQSGDAGIASAIMDAKRNNPEGPSKSSYFDQMGNALGFIGNTLVGKPGYGVSRFNSDAASPSKSANYDFTNFDKATDAYMAERAAKKAAANKVSVPTLNQDKIDAADNARIDKMLAPASVKPSITGTKEEAMDPYAEMRKEIADARAESKKQKGIDQYMAMLSAGLGIMGGKSQHAFENIGQGAQLGIQSLAQSNAQRAAEANALRSAQLGLIKYGAMEKQNQALMDFRNKQLGVQDQTRRDLAAEKVGLQRDQEKRLQQDAYARQLAEMVRTNQARALAAYKDPTILDEAKKAQIFAQADMALQRDPRYRELYRLANNGMLPPDLGASVGGEGWGIKPK